MSTIPIGIHPFCLSFPMMSDSELDALGADAKKRGGLIHPIIVFDILPDGTKAKGPLVLDGKNRWEACKRYNVTPRFERFTGTIEEAMSFVIAMDMRRHSTPEKRKEAIKALLKHNPKASNRRVAEQTKTSQNTVQEEREKLEESGDIQATEEREGSDGKTRHVPASTASPDAVLDDDGQNVETPKPKSHKKKSQNEGTCKSDPLNDALGNPVPDHLRDVFGDKWLGELIAKANEWSLLLQKGGIKTQLNGKGQAHMPWLKVSAAVKHLDEAIREIGLFTSTLMHGVPHCPCPSCNAVGCSLCFNTGWLPEWRLNDLNGEKE